MNWLKILVRNEFFLDEDFGWEWIFFWVIFVCSLKKMVILVGKPYNEDDDWTETRRTMNMFQFLLYFIFCFIKKGFGFNKKRKYLAGIKKGIVLCFTIFY
jgi:hypothetical protein